MTHEVLKKTEMAEAAKNAVESELIRWHQRDHQKAAETAARILAMAFKTFSLQFYHHVTKEIIKILHNTKA
ncbi:hypothetical protein RYX36_034869 [Vicia faba]